MADTIQAVLWALGQKCPLRQGAGWEEPSTAVETLSEIRTYWDMHEPKGRRGSQVYGDVCVTSVTAALPGVKCPYYDYPSGGFVLPSQFSSIGGLASVEKLCRDCPANGGPRGVAGCVGSLYQPLYSEGLQKQFAQLIDRLGLASKLDAVFPETSLHSFRFWIHSPIPTEGVRLLHQLLEAVYEDDEEEFRCGRKSDFKKWHGNLDAFIKALERSLNAHIPMHAQLTPPGHTDFGWYTIFSHCPRCKAEAPVERWKRKYRDEEIECAVCGAKYSPAKTRSAEHDAEQDSSGLRDILGQPEFEKLAAQWLVAQGASEAEAAQIVEKQEEWERARKEKLAEIGELNRRHGCFVENVIYHGLKNVNPGDESIPTWLFSPEDVEEIIRRCEYHGGEVLDISHVSESGEQDEHITLGLLRSMPAREAFQKLRDKGYNEKFSIFVKIPKEVVEGWKQQ